MKNMDTTRVPLFCLPQFSLWPQRFTHIPHTYMVTFPQISTRYSINSKSKMFNSKVPNLTIQTAGPEPSEDMALGLTHPEAQLFSICEPMKLEEQVICS